MMIGIKGLHAICIYVGLLTLPAVILITAFKQSGYDISY
jgi:hypothetical protein